MRIQKKIKRADSRAAAFTLIELIFSMALISIAISICIQTSGMFNDRLLSLQRRAETRTDLMRLAIYLDDLSNIGDAEAMCPIAGGELQGDIACTFHHASNFPTPDITIPIFSLADHGFVSAKWEAGQSLLLADAAGTETRVGFGIFPSVITPAPAE